MRVECPQCPVHGDVDIEGTHEPDRVCWSCNAPWRPEGVLTLLVDRTVEIGPEKAFDWLTAIPDTAGHWTLSRPQIAQKYARMMRLGEWENRDVDHPQAFQNPISFDPHGVLLTGVVRLLACVEAQTPFTTVVRRFSPEIPGHVPFNPRMHIRKVPRLLRHWHYLRETYGARI